MLKHEILVKFAEILILARTHTHTLLDLYVGNNERKETPKCYYVIVISLFHKLFPMQHTKMYFWFGLAICTAWIKW